MDEVTFILHSCVCGYHVYNDLWNATPGETLTCIRERGNRNDVFAVAAQSDGNIVGHSYTLAHFVYLYVFCT